MANRSGRDFFVYIVESPSAPDLYHGRSEAGIIKQALDLEGLPSETRVAISREAFTAAHVVGLPEVMKRFAALLPVLHISAHGNNEGLQLSNGETVLWSELRTLLLPINRSLNGLLLLCMSSCQGMAACQMAMQLDGQDHPFFAVVANYGQPTWPETAIAYACFYHLVRAGHSISDAVGAMKVASGNSDWIALWAEHVQKDFLDYCHSLDLSQAQQQLEQQAQSASLTPDTKALEQQRH